MYENCSLADDEIRLLRLVRNSTKAQIEVELFRTTLREHPAYTAVSYTWGDPTPMMTIRCNQVEHRVRKNLYEFLSNARENLKSNVYWIDAICIDQTDEGEKSIQVQMMRLIYASASKLLIWLGPANEHTSMAFKTFSEIIEQPEFHLVDDKREAVLDILNRAWWNRIWVVQELTAFRSVDSDLLLAFVFCGKWKIFWSDLVEVAIRMGSTDAKYGMPVQQGLKIQELEKARQNITGTLDHPPLEMYHLVKRYRSWESSDPRDKVYALLGQSDQSLFRADYSKRANVLFWEIAVFSIRDTKKLNILCHCQRRNPRALRSWVPDWSIPLSIPIILHSEDDHSFDSEWALRMMIEQEKQVVFTATGNSQARVEFSANMETLQAAGIIFDEIEQVTGVCFPQPSHHGFKVDYVETLRTMAEFQQYLLSHWHDKHPYETSDELQSALWNTVFTARDEFGYPLDQNDFSKWFPPIPKSWTPRPSLALSNVKVPSVRDWGDNSLDLVQSPFSWLFPDEYDPFKDSRGGSYAEYLEPKYITNRRLFFTKKGYVGLGPPHSKKGNCITLLLGGDVPFILGSVDAAKMVYTLVGECYIHGIMHGEAYDSWLESGRAAQSFNIV